MPTPKKEAAVAEVREEMEKATGVVVISFEGVDFIDSQGADKLAELLDLAEAYGAELRLARVKPDVLDLLDRAGVLERLGDDKIFGNVYNAVEDALPEAARRDSTTSTA